MISGKHPSTLQIYVISFEPFEINFEKVCDFGRKNCETALGHFEIVQSHKMSE